MLKITKYRYDILKFSDGKYVLRRRATLFTPGMYRDKDPKSKFWWTTDQLGTTERYTKMANFSHVYQLYKQEQENNNVLNLLSAMKARILGQDVTVIKTREQMAQEMLSGNCGRN